MSHSRTLPGGDAPLRIAVLGCGAVARSVHLPTLARTPDVQIVAVADADSRCRDEAARIVGGNAVALSDYRDALTRPDVAAVLIALPTHLHANAAEQAFAAGKHVYLEKPIAATVAEGARLLDAWSRAPGCIGMVGFNYRFNPLHVRTRERLTQGAVGSLTAIRSVFATPAANALPDWKRNTVTGGGVLLDLASHHIDLLYFFTGRDITEVSAMALSQRSEEDSAILNLRLGPRSDGSDRTDDDPPLLAQIFVSLCAADDDRWEFFGDSGRLTVDRYESVDARFLPPRRQDASPIDALKDALNGMRRLPYRLEKRRAAAHEPSYQVALSRFAEACRTATTVGGDGGKDAAMRTAVSPDLTDGLRCLQVIEAARESLRSGGEAVAPQP
jgi:myo-inositol 2-dehydrogenase / D-chiro-inositol 1-dehydrogenase